MRRTAALVAIWFAATAFSLQSGTGRATISGAPSACADSTSIQIWALTRNGERLSGPSEVITFETWLSPQGGQLPVALTFITGRPTDAACTWTFDELPAGQYVAMLVGPSGSGGSQLFSATPSRLTTVEIPAPQVELAGRILRDGTPVRTHIRVVPFPFARPAIVVTTDDDGRYRATLDRPGLHRIEAVGVGLMESNLSAGPNAVDISLDQDGF